MKCNGDCFNCPFPDCVVEVTTPAQDRREYMRNYKREYYAKNQGALREKHREYSRRWYAENRERAKECQAAYRARNAEHIKAQQKAYYERKKEEQRKAPATQER